jgi:hypothetical protein
MNKKALIYTIVVVLAIALAVWIMVRSGDAIIPAVVMAAAVLAGSYLGVRLSRKKSAEVEEYRQSLINGKKPKGSDADPESRSETED